MLSDRDARPADGPASAASHGRRLSPSGRRGGRQRVACLPERDARASGGRIRRRPGAVSQRRRSRRRRRVRATAPGARRGGRAPVPARARGGLDRGGRLVRPGRGPGAAGPEARGRAGAAPGCRARAGLYRRGRSAARVGRGLGARAPAGGAERGASGRGAYAGGALRGADRARLGAVLRERHQPRRRAAGEVPVAVSPRRLHICALARADRRGEREHGAAVHDPERAVGVVHGVWAELPPAGNYDAPGWKADFRREMRRAVDVVHGRALVGARAGHAWGRYDADVSDHVLAFVLGREWEPFSIRAYNRRPHGRRAYQGRFLAVERGTPADVWLAEQCDELLRYERDVYHAQRPIAYTNWPPLDPLRHSTESSRAEEQALRRRYGFPPNPRLMEYDNDVDALDAMLVRTTAADLGGYFAAYHAYPYYPDFIDLDAGYGAATSAEGPSHYFGYLLDLQRHHAGRPVLVAEYGVPSSRGVSHLQPEGMHHGGHDEEEMAAIDVRLTREIREAGLAGGIVFAWLDEWFKHTWVTIDLELPAERTRLWHNVMNAEQNYGLLGEYAGAADATPEPGGETARWRALPLLDRNDSIALRVGADPAYLYLVLEGGPELDVSRYVVGIDTHRGAGGERRLPGVAGASDVGFEFALVLNDTTDAQLLVVPAYNPYLVPRAVAGPTALDAFYHWGATLEGASAGGAWDSLFVTTNRWRIGRDGRTYAARGVNRGRLRYGRAAASSLADWYVDRDAGLVEVRLAWGLLNVTDPSSRRVLRRIALPDRFETTVSEGLRFTVAAVARDDGAVRAWLPGATFAWASWEEPVWHERLKPAYAALRDVWGSW